MTYLAMYRGDDRALTITASEDLTGAEVRFTAKRSRYVEETAIAKGPGEIEVSGTTATVPIGAADTNAIEPGTLYWDVEVIDAADATHTVATGRLVIRRDITRPAP